MECTQSFHELLSEFQCVFTEPTFPIFVCLMTGWVLSHRRRFVTDLICSSGCVHKGHHSRYHRFFSKSAWVLDTLSSGAGQAVDRGLRAHGHHRAGGGRHALPQTRTDRLRHAACTTIR